MAKMAVEKGINVILIGPALHDQHACSPNGDPIIGSSKKNLQYSKAVQQVAGKLKIPFVDLWHALLKEGGWSFDEICSNSVSCAELIPDGIHFSPRAYQVLYRELVDCIHENYPQLDAGALRRKLTLWREINNNDIERLVFHPL